MNPEKFREIVREVSRITWKSHELRGHLLIFRKKKSGIISEIMKTVKFNEHKENTK